MKDVNLAIRKAYYAALTATGLPVFYGEAPDNITDPVYIVFSAINSSDASTFNSDDTNTTVQVKIHTWANKYNPGTSGASAADEVFQRVYPNRAFNLDLTADGFQMLNTTVSNDFEEPLGMLAGRKYLDRTIIFSHKIFIL